MPPIHMTPRDTPATDPIARAPDLSDTYGRAWRVPLPANSATVAFWLIEAAWAHPLWHSYLLSVTHLREGDDLPAVINPELGGTHEIVLFAIDPRHPREPHLISDGPPAWPLLHGANFVGRLDVASDAAAADRAEGAVKMILDARLSPDTDFRQQWAMLFPAVV